MQIQDQYANLVFLHMHLCYKDINKKCDLFHVVWCCRRLVGNSKLEKYVISQQDKSFIYAFV